MMHDWKKTKRYDKISFEFWRIKNRDRIKRFMKFLGINEKSSN